MLLTRDELLKKQVLEIEKVELGDDNHIFVKEMTAGEKEGWELSQMDETRDASGKLTGYTQNIKGFRANLAIRTVCDESGDLLFEEGDAKALNENMGAARMELIANAAQRLNKVTKEDQDAMLKNSGGDQDASSSSDSVDSSE